MYVSTSNLHVHVNCRILNVSIWGVFEDKAHALVLDILLRLHQEIHVRNDNIIT